MLALHGIKLIRTAALFFLGHFALRPDITEAIELLLQNLLIVMQHFAKAV